ncbi:amino acid adenylation domain-containing protein [Amycolatopsis thailandensis]|uniref:amino acid adenylation domain-containing protein n=1 Tax=Amycolatopsis thailandensis TaxID=589330 RepID=UPI003647736E
MVTPSQWTRNAKHCHALCLRLDGPVDAGLVAERFASIAGPGELWAERVPFGAEDPASAQRRARELARPVDARRGARGALIEYPDGRADLVIVAHRAAFDGPALRLLATAAAAGGPGPERSSARTSGADHVPAWGLGDRGLGHYEPAEFRVSLPSGTDRDPEGWKAALAAVLARYEPEERLAGAGILFDLDGFDSGDPDSGDTGEYVPCLAPPFPLTVTVGRAGGLRCHYRPGAVSLPVATRFVRHLVEAHRTAGKDIFDEAEREQVLALGRPSRAPSTTPRRIPEVFAERAAERPDAIALSDEDGQVRYGELDRWSARLADGLRAAGVNPGDLVGVCLDRSAELVAVLLAVLKVGAAYVPLDPAYPAERLAYTVEDARLAVVITTHNGFPVSGGLRVLTPRDLTESHGDAEPSAVGGADEAAYVIYTSGSTGRPKGVLVPHSNVVALVDATRDDFALGATDVWTFFHSVAFDFSVWEIWGCLLTGGHLVVVPYWVSRSPEQLRDLLAERGVTVLSQTPSAFAPLTEVERARHDRLPVRLVIFGGEPLPVRSLLPWLDRYPETRCRLVNMFGITETTVHVTAETVTRWHALAGSRSVGRPVPGWRVYVLDESGRLAPPGVAGEIHVAGAGVALGYLRRPGLTAERFLPDPFGGGRMYRTGDRGRLRPDGVLEHLGRQDDQVKLRGFRIEPDEIRSVLAEGTGVVAAAVTVRGADAASRRLDAYVVLSEGTTAAVRERISRILPDHMVPATITVLPAIPMTANGKVDLAALPDPVEAVPESDVDDEPPAGVDGLAGELLAVWRQVLGFAVGASDSFWEVGGNSLLAMRIAAAMRERGLPPLHPRALYLNPTVRKLAASLTS